MIGIGRGLYPISRIEACERRAAGDRDEDHRWLFEQVGMLRKDPTATNRGGAVTTTNRQAARKRKRLFVELKCDDVPQWSGARCDETEHLSALLQADLWEASRGAGPVEQSLKMSKNVGAQLVVALPNWRHLLTNVFARSV